MKEGEGKHGIWSLAIVCAVLTVVVVSQQLEIDGLREREGKIIEILGNMSQTDHAQNELLASHQALIERLINVSTSEQQRMDKYDEFFFDWLGLEVLPVDSDGINQ